MQPHGRAAGIAGWHDDLLSVPHFKNDGAIPAERLPRQCVGCGAHRPISIHKEKAITRLYKEVSTKSMRVVLYTCVLPSYPQTTHILYMTYPQGYPQARTRAGELFPTLAYMPAPRVLSETILSIGRRSGRPRCGAGLRFLPSRCNDGSRVACACQSPAGRSIVTAISSHSRSRSMAMCSR